MINLDQTIIPPGWTIDQGNKPPIASFAVDKENGTVGIEVRAPENDFRIWLRENFSPEDIATFDSIGDEKEQLLSTAVENGEVEIEVLGPRHQKRKWVDFEKNLQFANRLHPDSLSLYQKIWYLWHMDSNG